MASTRTATASRSAAVRCGFQTSMISTTRVLRSAVPCLVLVGVVERDCLALAPGVRLAADHQRAILRDDERQVADDARVGDAAVRQDVRARRQHREHHLGRVAADAHERQRLERRRRARAERMVVVAPLAVAVEVEAVPGRRAALAGESAPLGFVAVEHALAVLRARHRRRAAPRGSQPSARSSAANQGNAVALDARARRAGPGNTVSTASGAGPRAARGARRSGSRGIHRSARAPRGHGGRRPARGPCSKTRRRPAFT